MRPFSELRVVEVAGSIAGAYAGKLFSDFGARVLKVEPVDGDPSRRTSPLMRLGASTEFEYLNTGKSSLCLDLAADADRERLRGICAACDVIIESFSPGPPAPVPDDITRSGEAVRVRISPFGLDGPWSDRRSTPFTDFAAGGHMYLTGEPTREPLQGAPNQTLFAAGTHAFIGAMAALRAREQDGVGQDVDVSHLEVMASLHQWTTVRYTHGGVIQRRVGNRYGSLHPSTIYQCRDGYVAFGAVGNEPLSRFLAVIGMPELLLDARFTTGAARFAHADEFDEVFGAWMLGQSVEDVVATAQAVRAPVAPVNSLSELLADPHLAARSFWKKLPGTGSEVRFPGPPFRMSRHPWELKPAPKPGEGGDAWLSAAESEVAPESPPDASRATGSGARRAPLDGIRILDLTRVWAGPLATRMLADLGADVIKVEALWARGLRTVSKADVLVSGRYPGNEAGARPWNREGMFSKLNRNKRSVTVQLDTPAGKNLFERLVPLCDVVIENYTPRVMPQLGLGYERLRELNPGVVYVSMPGYGWDGPSRDFAALGTTLEPEAGLSSMMGYADSGPYKSGVAWADPVAAMHGASAVLLGLHDRDADPERWGQAIELAQFEGMVCFIGAEVLAAQDPGQVPPRRGNRHGRHAPQGCYPCLGDDRWIAMTITNDEQWTALCEVAGLESAWRSFGEAERRKRSDEIDRGISTWTNSRDRDALELQLQRCGIAACAVNDARDLVEHPQLASRGFFVNVQHPEAGAQLLPGLPIHLAGTQPAYGRPAPCLGEHNREILEELLGLRAAELEALAAAGVIGDAPPA